MSTVIFLTLLLDSVFAFSTACPFLERISRTQSRILCMYCCGFRECRNAQDGSLVPSLEDFAYVCRTVNLNRSIICRASTCH